MICTSALNLGEKSLCLLAEIISFGKFRKERRRAKTLILLAENIPQKEVAQLMGVTVRTVYSTRASWLANGIHSLPDRPRSGAPRKITPVQAERLAHAARSEPFTARALLAMHVEDGNPPVHLNTITSTLRASGLVWKRTRYSLRHKRNELAFRAAQAKIETMRAQAASGEITLAYVDEAGFSQIHPNRSAWTPKGERHLIEATRGKPLNVLAARLSTGGLFSAKLWQPTTAGLFVGFLGLLAEHVGKALTVILDNASIHKAKEIKPHLKFLAEKGVTLYFLPPYSPELNRIQRLWRKMKYTWMSPKCRDSKSLEADVEEILSNFGSKYEFAF